MDQNQSEFPAITPTAKNGEERFTFQGGDLGCQLKDFWSWYASDLVGNTLRGCLAEFIVAKALGCVGGVRTEWDACDVKTKAGIKIEVKSAAYIQSWRQARPSKISFGIAPTQGWNADTNDYSRHAVRQSEIYIFCLLGHQDQASINPLELSQWDFLVVPTWALNQSAPKQKRITLGSLIKLEHRRVDFGGLQEAVAWAASFSPVCSSS